MKTILTSFLLFVLFYINHSSNAPVIAILANPEPDNTNDAQKSRVNYQYVRWLEQNRAEVIVIQPWYEKKEIEEIVSKANGVLWLGGDRKLNMEGQFEKVAKVIMEKVKDLYDNHNISVPLWGTCQGFELIHALVAGSLDVLTNFDSFGMTSNILLSNREKSKMFASFSDLEVSFLEKFNTTAQFHNYGVNEEEFKRYPQLDDLLEITSYGYDRKGLKYISTVEGKHYPIYAVQFHPEMVGYTKFSSKGVPQSVEAVRVSQLLGTFFFEEILKNQNQMTKEEMLKYNYLNSFEKLPLYEEEYYFYRFEKNKKNEKNLPSNHTSSNLNFLEK
jgi:gamma-glutamyl hydrolase